AYLERFLPVGSPVIVSFELLPIEKRHRQKTNLLSSQRLGWDIIVGPEPLEFAPHFLRDILQEGRVRRVEVHVEVVSVVVCLQIVVVELVR
ncbi:hypothetical protein PENTCL1PPCAC_28878, partial [Pristionchus entomophagus]